MRPVYLLLALLFVWGASLAQNTESDAVLDSILLMQWNPASGSWQNYRIRTNQYDGGKQPVRINYATWRPAQREWMPETRLDLRYSPTGALLERVEANFDLLTRRWLSNSKTVNEYEEGTDRLSKRTVYLYSTATRNWEPYARNEQAYDEQGNTILQATFWWDSSLNDWVGDTRYRMRYSPSNKLVEMELDRWRADSWQKIQRTKVLYNDSDVYELVLIDVWLQEQEMWEKAAKTEYEWLNTEKIRRREDFYWNRGALEWIAEEKETWSYFEGGQSEVVYAYFSRALGQYVEWLKYMVSEGAGSNSVTVCRKDQIQADWDCHTQEVVQTNQYDDVTYREVLTFNAKQGAFRQKTLDAFGWGRNADDLVTYTSNFRYDTLLHDWRGNYYEVAYYTPEGNMTDAIRYVWSFFNRRWEGGFRYRYFWSEGQGERVGQMQVFPNPSNGAVQVDLYPFLDQMGYVEVFDSQGVRLYHEPAGRLEAIKALDMRGYEKGVYFVRVTTQGKSFTERVVVH